MDNIQYLTRETLLKLELELNNIKDNLIPELAKKIDDAKQLGDLSENAEYHQAKDDMAWAQTRIKEIEEILENVEVIDKKKSTMEVVTLGSVVEIEVNGKKKEYQIVGQQEADPLNGKISNESPIGRALIGAKLKEEIKVLTPSGEQIYKIKRIS